MSADSITLGILAAWAVDFSLPSPRPPATATLEVSTSQLRRIATYNASVAGGLARGRDAGLQAGRLVVAGWGNEAVQRALTALQDAADAIAAQARHRRDLVDRCADAIAAAQQQVRSACRDAASSIASEAYLAGPMGSIPEATRRSIVATAYRRIAAAARSADLTARTLTAGLGNDPRHLLPAGVSTASAAATTLQQTDHDNEVWLDHDLSAGNGHDRALAGGVQEAIREAKRRGLQADLLTYDPGFAGGQGGVAIAIGDVAHADNVSVIVPGIGNSPADMTDAVDLAADLDAATSAAAGSGATSATVLWFDYDIPASWPHDPPPSAGNLFSHIAHDSALALDAAGAAAAAPRLAHFMTRLNTMVDPSAGVTMMGHSYGSVVASQAATLLGPDAGVDDVVLLASPGAGYGVDSVHDYTAVSPDHAYTLAFPGDPVPNDVTDTAAAMAGGLLNFTGLVHPTHPLPFGRDPNRPGFGATRVDTPSNVPFEGPIDLDQHSLDNYLSGDALDAVAAITAGRYDSVPTRGSS